MVDSLDFKNVNYTLGGEAVINRILYTTDTVSAFFYKGKNLKQDERGDRAITCAVSSPTRTSFFSIK